ncbi:hypothetical protein [Sediminibacterium soli]|uniref:hypothetical protein n=1 Tax=Sediminibacterium soli TaxID=2698829 RepID=UPI00137B4B84|nr:hypothetical protein [Sediminibacterium soli]NCI48211.1 hypothetical protein [Sediminibacterium soli]
MKCTGILLLIALFAACSPRKRETIAYITERRVDQTGKLVLTYQFRVDQKWVLDSAQVDNRVIPNDSLKVVFSSENPAENRLQMP